VSPTGIEEAALTAIARKLATRLSDPAMARLEGRLRRRVGRTPTDLVLKDALREAIERFRAGDSHGLVDMLFDEPFLGSRAARDVLLRALDPYAPLPVTELADAWHAQFAFVNRADDALVVPACREFLENFRQAVRTHTTLRAGFDSARIDQIHARIEEISATLDYRSALKTDQTRFAEPITDAYASLGQTVRQLTDDQYRVLELLRHFRHALISGTAGSGKTLVAAEKAMRLADAGVSTLFCCHNPELATWVRELTDGSRVAVIPFEQLVRDAARPEADEAGGRWSSYSQPTTDELDAAFAAILERGHRYEAVIVDEGQDFAEDWWLLIEALLADGDDTYFYIFYDDQQALQVHRSSYPLEMPPLDLSRNCRNAGQIYTAMRVLDPAAPAPEEALAQHGRLVLHAAEPTLVPAVETCVRWLAKTGELRSCVVLLGGGSTFEESALAPWMTAGPLAPWQPAVIAALMEVVRRVPEVGRAVNPPPARVRTLLGGLTREAFPTTRDVELVASVAAQILTPAARGDRRPCWGTSQSWRGPTSARVATGGTSPRDVVDYFRDPAWATEVPAASIGNVRFLPHDACDPSARPIYTVGEFKGLESDAILLVMQGNAPELRSELFVGISRARGTLAVALDQVTLSRLSLGEQRALGLRA
jgi:hypothetical protein